MAIDISEEAIKVANVNIYNKSGMLINSSESDVFNKGIVSKSMDAMAFSALSRMKKLKYTQEEEKVGSLTYKAAYLPLKLSILKFSEN